MPGKVNPVMSEMVVQVAAQVIRQTTRPSCWGGAADGAFRAERDDADDARTIFWNRSGC